MSLTKSAFHNEMEKEQREIPIVVRRETTEEMPISLYYVKYQNPKFVTPSWSGHFSSLEGAKQKAEKILSKGNRVIEIVKDCCSGFAF